MEEMNGCKEEVTMEEGTSRPIGVRDGTADAGMSYHKLTIIVGKMEVIGIRRCWRRKWECLWNRD